MMWLHYVQCGASGCDDGSNAKLVVPLVIGAVSLCLIVLAVLIVVKCVPCKAKAKVTSSYTAPV